MDPGKDKGNGAKMPSVLKDRPPAPDRDCRVCGERRWYWPGDYYFGKKTWQCGRCNPPPAGQEVEYPDEIH